MTIQEFLAGTSFIPTQPVPNGKANTPEQLYNNCISVPYPSDTHPDAAKVTQAIKDWHKLLVWYANQDGAVFLSRLYESQRTNGVDDNRRNSLTVSNNYSYAFCSNYFPRIILSMALNGFCPTEADFWNWLVTNKTAHLGYFKSTAIERRIAAYPLGSYNAKFYTSGWYLAHIISVNAMTYKGHNNIDVRDIFQLGDESMWEFDATLGKIIRKNGSTIDANQKAVAIAHFLRCVDPINYFLVPNKNNVVYHEVNAGDGTPLGENRFVVEYMLIKAFERFGDTLEDFLNLSLADVDIHSICSAANKAKISASPIDAVYKIGINNNGAPTLKNTYDKELEVAAYYLRHNVGLVKVEENVLKLSGKKGWTAQTILRSLGIVDTSAKSIYKGLLSKPHADIDVEISRATGIFKTTLEEIKKRGL